MMKIQRLSNQYPTYWGTSTRKLHSTTTRCPWDYNDSFVRYLLYYSGEGSIVRDSWHLPPACTVCLSTLVGCKIFAVYPKNQTTHAHSLEYTGNKAATRIIACRASTGATRRSCHIAWNTQRQYFNFLFFCPDDVGFTMSDPSR